MNWLTAGFGFGRGMNDVRGMRGMWRQVGTLVRAQTAAVLFTIGILGVTSSSAHADTSKSLTVFAAASLKTVLDQVAADWASAGGPRVQIAYAGSSQLARQIQFGAPADLFISANVAWMDALERDRLIAPATRRVIATNRLVLIAHGRKALPVSLGANGDLAKRLGDQRLAMALVAAVPAGIYGKAALENLGMWPAVSDRVAQSDNVRTALAFVARGEAPFGIVYATDAAASDNVTVVATFPADSHPPIQYPAAVVAQSKQRSIAKRFIRYLAQHDARRRLEEAGFGLAPRQSVGAAHDGGNAQAGPAVR